MDPTCLFCKIIAGQIPSTKILENEHALAFKDIAPKAPTHIVVVPKKHYAGLHEIPVEEMDLIKNLFSTVSAIVTGQKLDQAGYRLVINHGEQGGQTVPHLHVHLLSGREMHWPPG